MRPSKTRYQLWQIMLAIAVLAWLFAVFGVVFAVGIIIGVSLVFLPVMWAEPSRRVEALVWVSSIYPLLNLSSVVTVQCLDYPSSFGAGSSRR